MIKPQPQPQTSSGENIKSILEEIGKQVSSVPKHLQPAAFTVLLQRAVNRPPVVVQPAPIAPHPQSSGFQPRSGIGPVKTYPFYNNNGGAGQSSPFFKQNNPMQKPQVILPDRPTDIPLDFGDFMAEFKDGMREHERFLIAACFAESKQKAQTFTVKDAAALLKKEKIKMTVKPDAVIETLLGLKCLIVVDQNKKRSEYRVSPIGNKVISDLRVISSKQPA